MLNFEEVKRNLDADVIGRMSPVDTSGCSAKRSLVIEWINNLFPSLNIPLEASDEDLRVLLSDGTVLWGIVNRQDPSSLVNQRGAYLSSEQRREKIRRFLSAVEGMGLPRFTVDDLENGSIFAVIDCLLSLRNHFNSELGEHDEVHRIVNYANQRRKKWFTSKDDRVDIDTCHGNLIRSGKNSPLGEGERKKNCSESIYHRPVMPEQTASMRHAGNKFNEVFQLKQGRYSDIPAAKISEIMKSNGLDNAPTRSLLGVVNGILDESIERKNGELPLRVASLLRKVVYEIERRIATQMQHIRNQNDLIKAREKKYQTRIRVLETLASGINEETKMVSSQLLANKVQKTAIEESMKQEEQQTLKLREEKENNDQKILEKKHELEAKINEYEHHYQHLDDEAKQTEARLQERLKEAEFFLSESSKRVNELKAHSELKLHNWTEKEHGFHNFISFHLQSLKGFRTSSESIRVDVTNLQTKWREELNSLGFRIKVLLNSAENYHAVLAENKKLYNEVQELKGNIRVYCRVRPFLPRQIAKSATVEYIGDNGELVLANPSKPGKDGRRVFKFNKVFGQTTTQAQVFMEIQPLIRSVLDGYNVCIFAYGQTGSGKTYTMSGPDSPSEEDWGVNCRALNDLFQISQVRSNAYKYEVAVQMVEIYNEQIRDLLSNSGSQKRLGILNTSQPHGLAVPDAIMVPVKSSSDVIELMECGQANRAVGSTAVNERSSRSHSILTVHVRGVDLKTGSITRGCLHLIDLAGSERVDRSEVTGDRLKESQYINKSLSALGDVVFALFQKSAHVPYRNSKLTQILQSSLGGQAKTLMFVQINPDVESYSETLSTLKFAERASGVELGAARSSKEGRNVKDLIEEVASLKDTIARKDEKIEQLQKLKGLRTQSPQSNSSRQSSSSPGVLSSSGGGMALKFSEKDGSNAEKGQNSDVGSKLSMCNGGTAYEDCDVDETGDNGNKESDGALGEVLARDLSFGEKADNTTESDVHPEAVEASENTADKVVIK